MEEMESCGDVVTLTPISFPLTKDGESRFNPKGNLVIVSECLRRGDVSNEIPVVETSDVSRKIS